MWVDSINLFFHSAVRPYFICHILHTISFCLFGSSVYKNAYVPWTSESISRFLFVITNTSCMSEFLNKTVWVLQTMVDFRNIKYYFLWNLLLLHLALLEVTTTRLLENLSFSCSIEGVCWLVWRWSLQPNGSCWFERIDN